MTSFITFYTIMNCTKYNEDKLRTSVSFHRCVRKKFCEKKVAKNKQTFFRRRRSPQTTFSQAANFKRKESRRNQQL